MSKIGCKPIIIPESVNLTINNLTVHIKGKEGEIEIKLPKNIKGVIQNKQFYLQAGDQEKKTISLQGLYRQLVYNAVIGVNKLWEKNLEIVGTGYNAKLQGEDLVLKLGFSHPVLFKKVPGVKFQVKENNKITVSGIDKQLVGQVAYQIKILKKPDNYKGKGIRYFGEQIKLKPSKKVKVTGATA